MKHLLKKVIESSLPAVAFSLVRQLRLARVRRKLWSQKPGALLRCLGYRVRITDGPNFYMQYKDEFINRVYHFAAAGPEPLIIDGGSNMGMSILALKRVYPKARIIGFEPDPAIFRIVSENLAHNRIEGVELINAGLSAQDGEAFFTPDGQAGGQLSDAGPLRVKMERLSKYLGEPVDFLKLNIEGAELDVLAEAAAAGLLRNVRELVLEYHGWPNEEQKLGKILTLLDEQRYRYLIHDFDAETCASSKPPFRLAADTTWFCLVYAKRNDLL
jgi:FkbM family methyltransferase